MHSCINLLKGRFILVALSVYLTPKIVCAQYFTGPVASGVGGAGVASAEVAESAFLNPASLAHSPTFSSGVFYQDGWFQGVSHRTDLAVNIVDNSDGLYVPGSIGYVQRRQTFKGASPVDQKFYHIAVGDFVGHQFSVGLGLYYLESETLTDKYTRVNGNLGFMWNPNPDLGWGIVVYNLRKEGDDTPGFIKNPTKAMIGFNYIVTEFLRFRADGGQQLHENPENDWEWKLGFETFLNKFMVLRFGWHTGAMTEKDEISAGWSFIGPRFSLDYAYRRTQAEESNGALHSVDLRLPFW